MRLLLLLSIVVTLAFAGCQPASTTSKTEELPVVANTARTFRLSPVVKFAAHQEDVTSVACSADGKWIATLADDVKLYDAPTGKLRISKPLPGAIDEYHRGSIAFSPDSRLFAVASADRVMLVDLAAGKVAHRLEGKELKTIHAVQFTPDGKWLIVLQDQRAVIFDTKKYQVQRELPCIAMGAGAIALTADSRQVLVPGEKGAVICYEIASGKRAYVLPAATLFAGDAADGGWIMALSIDPKDRRLAVASFGDLILVDLKSRKVAIRSPYSCQRMAFSAEGYLAAISGGGLTLLDVSGDKVHQLTHVDFRRVRQDAPLVFTHDSRRIIAPGLDSGKHAVAFAVEWSLERSHVASQKEPYHAIAASSEAKQLACFSEGHLEIFSLRSHEELEFYKLIDVPFEDARLAYSPDGKHLLLTSGGKYKPWVMLFAVPSLKVEGTFDTEKFSVYNACFTPDSKKVIVTSNLGAKLWDIGTGAVTDAKLDADVGRVVFTQPDRLLSVKHTSGKLFNWPAATPGMEWAAGQTVSDFAVSPGGATVATCSATGNRIVVHDQKSGKEIKRIDAGCEHEAVEFSADGKWLLAGGSDARLRIWSTSDWKLHAAVIAHYAPITQIAKVPGSDDFLTISQLNYNERCAVKRWSLEELLENAPVPVADPKEPEEEFTSGVPAYQLGGTGRIAPGFTNNGKSLYWRGKKKNVDIYSRDGGTLEQSIEVGEPIEIAMSEDGKWLAATNFWDADAGEEGAIKVWNAKTGKIAFHWEPECSEPGGFCFSPDGKSLAAVYGVGDGKGELSIWSLENGKRRKRISVSGRPTAVAYSPNGALLAYGDSLGKVALREVASGATRFSRDLSDTVFQIKFSANGSSLAAYCGDLRSGTAHLLDTTTGERKTGLENFQDTTLAVAFSPTGNLLVVASKLRDGQARLTFLEMPAAKPVRRLVVDSPRLGGDLLQFSSGGEYLASNVFGPLQIWRMDDLMNIELQQQLAALQDENLHVSFAGNAINVFFPFKAATDGALKRMPLLSRPFNLYLNGAGAISDEGLAALARQSNLSSLDLSGSRKVTAAGLAALQDVPLKRLDISHSGLTSSQAMAAVGKLQQLEWLRFSGAADEEAPLDLAPLDLSPLDLAPLANLKELRELRIGSLSTSASQFAHLAKLTRLQYFAIEKSDLQDEFLKPFVSWKNLEHLHLGVGDKFTGAGISFLTGNQKLQTLVIEGKSFGVSDEAGALREFRHLKTLDVSQTSITDAGLAAVGELTTLQRLQIPRSIGDAGLAHLADLTQVKELDLSGRPVTDAGLLHLSKWKSLASLQLYGVRGVRGPGLAAFVKSPQLTALELASTGVADEGLQAVGRLTQLKELSLPPGISDDGLQHIASLKQLTKLDIQGAFITDASAKTIGKLAQLEDINISDTALTDAAIPELLKLSQLKKIDLEDTKITKSGEYQLEAAFPLLLIYAP